MNSVLSAAGVPQIAGVFGDCIAGGGYMPIISDRVYMTEQAYMVIAGAALIKGAKSQKLTSLDIGGPEVHVHQSACADVRVPDDVECVRQLRAEVCRLPTSGADFYRHGVEAEGPLFDPAMLDGILPKNHARCTTSGSFGGSPTVRSSTVPSAPAGGLRGSPSGVSGWASPRTYRSAAGVVGRGAPRRPLP
jgi:hypothetical protein